MQSPADQREIVSDNGVSVSGYSTGGSSMREDSNTDSDIDTTMTQKETMFSDDFQHDGEDIPLKHMRGLMDHKVLHKINCRPFVWRYILKYPKCMTFY